MPHAFRRSLVSGLALLAVSAPALAAARPEGAFLNGLLTPGPAPDTLLVRSYANRASVAAYDGALAALWLLEQGRREEAGRLLAGLAAIQRPDGALAFSFALPAPEAGVVYVRSGAMAWVGYAAARYLNDAADGPARGAIAAMAHRLAAYLLARRVTKAGDPREGLVTGGSGRYHYEVRGGAVEETLVPGELAWASSEHNIDAYFFLKAFGRVAERPDYEQAADALAGAIVARLWDEAAGQFIQGMGDGPDLTRALDCASWGAIFLAAVGDRPRAERAYQAAEARYSSEDPASGARGHRPYQGLPLYENRALAEHFSARFPENQWDRMPAVWPEGSAGVALAALRLGRPERARSILAELAKLRRSGGGLPCLTVEVPLLFESAPALAGTAWVALVESELSGKPGMIWAPQP